MRSFLKSGLGIALALASTASQSRPRQRPQPQPQPGRYCNTQPYADVRQWMQNGSVLHLRQLLNLGRECDGMFIDRITIWGGSDNRYGGQAMILVNQQQATYAQNFQPGYVQQYDFYLNGGYNQLGNYVQNLQAYFQGLVYVERVAITLSNYGGGYPPPGGGGGGYPPPPGGGQPGGQPGYGTVDLGVVGFAGHTAQDTVLYIGGQKGAFSTIELYGEYDASIVNSATVYYENGAVVNLGSFVVPMRTPYRLNVGWNGRGQYIRQIVFNAQKGSASSYGVHMRATGYLANP